MRIEHAYLIAVAAFASVLAVHARIRANRFDTLNTYRSSPFRAVLKVESTEGWNAWNKGWGSFRARHEHARIKVIMHLEDGVAPPEPGEAWEVCGWLGKPHGGTRKLWVTGRGAHAAKVRDLPGKGFTGWCGRVRRNLSARMGLGLEDRPDTANLNRAIILGERRRIGPDARGVFITAGTMHIFAISGLHVMMVAKIVMVALSLLMVPPRLASLIMIPVLWVYVNIAGFAPSAVRAAVMASLYFAAPLFGRQPNAIIAWSLAFIAMHIAEPLNILDAGSLLSFAVMLGLILMNSYLRGFGRLRFPFLVYSLAAWTAGAPVVAHVFGRITPAGLLANLVLVPVAALEVAAGFLGIAASFVFAPLARLCNGVAAMLTELMYAVSYALAQLPLATIEVRPWGFWGCVEWYALAALILLLAKLVHSRRKAVLL